MRILSLQAEGSLGLAVEGLHLPSVPAIGIERCHEGADPVLSSGELVYMKSHQEVERPNPVRVRAGIVVRTERRLLSP